MNYIKQLCTNYFENQNEIIKKVFIGNCVTLHDLDFIHKNNIKLIINCTSDIEETNLKSFSESIKPKFIRISVLDNLQDDQIQKMYQEIQRILPFMFQCYSRQENILVCCRAGRQRSAIVVACFLQKYHSVIPDFSHLTSNCQMYSPHTYRCKCLFNGIQHVQIQRPQAFSFGLRVNFQKCFDQLFSTPSS